MRLISALWDFVRDEQGPTAVEYAVMLALIIVVCMTAVTILGWSTASKFERVAASIGGG